MRLQGAIFDMDGTLLDSMPIWKGFSQRFLRDLGREPEADLDTVVKTMTLRECARYFREHYRLPQSERELIEMATGRIHRFYAEEAQPKADVEKFLSLLKMEGVWMYVATSTDRRLAEAALRCAGIDGMIGGQVIDVKETGHAVPKDVLDTIYELKTGALIECAMMIGAILGGAEEEDVRKVEKIAHYVGIAFQIQDDILDVTSTEEVLGKPIHSDEKNQKTTYVTLLGIEQAQKRVEELSNQAIDLLHQLSGENEYLEQLLIQLIHRDR